MRPFRGDMSETFRGIAVFPGTGTAILFSVNACLFQSV